MSEVSLGLVLAGAALVLTGAAVGCGEKVRAPTLVLTDAEGGSYSYGGASPDPDDGVNHFPGATGSGQCSGSESIAHVEGDDWEWDATAEDATFMSEWYADSGRGVSIVVSGYTLSTRRFRFWNPADPLVEKTYTDVVPYDSTNPDDEPEMRTGCFTFSDATFSISDIVWDEDDNEVERFSATFEQTCEDTDETVTGCILFVRGKQ